MNYLKSVTENFLEGQKVYDTARIMMRWQSVDCSLIQVTYSQCTTCGVSLSTRHYPDRPQMCGTCSLLFCIFGLYLVFVVKLLYYGLIPTFAFQFCFTPCLFLLLMKISKHFPEVSSGTWRLNEFIFITCLKLNITHKRIVCHISLSSLLSLQPLYKPQTF